MSSALFILRWSCCCKCALSVLWRSYSKTLFLIKNFGPCDNSFFSDGTRPRHPWGQRGGRRRSLYDAHGTEGSNDVREGSNMMWIWRFWKCHCCLKPIFCLSDAHETKGPDGVKLMSLKFIEVYHNMMWNAYSPKCRNFHPNDVNSKCKDHRLIMWKTCWNTRTNTWCAETILDVERILWNDLPSQLVELEVCLMNKACTFLYKCVLVHSRKEVLHDSFLRNSSS